MQCPAYIPISAHRLRAFLVYRPYAATLEQIFPMEVPNLTYINSIELHLHQQPTSVIFITLTHILCH